ncbi:MAG TPA: ABC transporter permease [Candidatus Acidoferrum sp.]|nr:ABC transporter permease [Candidatus Acidoferrum sp.]
MANFARNVRFGLRLLGKNLGFTCVALLALILGIGANTAIFSVVHATLLSPMPYPNPDQLVMVWSKINGDRNGVSAGDFLDWKRQSTVFQSICAWSGGSYTLSASDHPEQLQTRVVTPGFNDMVGTPYFLGRDFLPEEGEVGRDRVVVMTHRLWEERFGSDRDIIGKPVRLNGERYAVVGVLAAGQPDRLESQLFVPLAFKPEQINHDFHFILVMGRLKPGVTLQQANADMDSVTRHIAEVYPKSNKGWGATVEPLQNDFISKDTIKNLWLLMGAVGFILLIACVNVANLLLARGTVRQKEIAVRAALGATRWQLFAQFLTESVALSLIGGALGVGLAWIMLKVIVAIMPPFTLPSEADLRLNLPVLFFSFAASLVSGVLFGCAPAWQTARQNLSDTLKETGRSAVGAGRHGLRRTLVVIEFALALTLLAGAGLVIHSFWKLSRVELGFRQDHILTFFLPVTNERFAHPEQINAFYRQLLDKIGALPGITAVTASTGMPIIGTNFGMPFNLAGQAVEDPSSRPGAGFNMVTPEYFRTFGIRMIQGRTLTEQDAAGGLPVAVVNETFAKKYLSKVDPLTQRIVVDQLIPGVTKLGPAVEWQIVGVYHDVHNGGVRGDGFPEIDVPFWQSPWPQAGLAARTFGDPASMTKSIAAVVRSVDPDLPLDQVKTMDQLVHESLANDRFSTALFGSFAGVALLLAAIGIYGVMSFAVAQRTHEIGLRIALGAGPRQVLRLVLQEGMLLAFAGLVVGLAGTYSVGRLMKSVLYQVNAMDPAAISAVTAVLLLSALLACYIPARRATQVDPMVALRDE